VEAGSDEKKETMRKTIDDERPVTQFAARIPEALHQRLRVVSVQHRRPMHQIVHEALEPVVARLERETRT
jgi:predicted HicB family RNase H-like nuclease